MRPSDEGYETSHHLKWGPLAPNDVRRLHRREVRRKGWKGLNVRKCCVPTRHVFLSTCETTGRSFNEVSSVKTSKLSYLTNLRTKLYLFKADFNNSFTDNITLSS
jgi:hypothetical protein